MASIYGDILTQCKANVDSITFPVTTRVVIRKSLTIEQVDTIPLVILAPTVENEFEDGEGFETVVGITYPVAVGIAINPGLEINGSDEYNMLTYRELIRRSLRSVNVIAPTSSPVSVINISCDLNPAFDKPARRDDFDWSSLLFNYTVTEIRNV